MIIRNVLVVYKKSAYQIYVLERKNRLFVGRERKALDWDIQRCNRHTRRTNAPCRRWCVPSQRAAWRIG